jgi:hypothetical protein
MIGFDAALAHDFRPSLKRSTANWCPLIEWLKSTLSLGHLVIAAAVRRPFISHLRIAQMRPVSIDIHWGSQAGHPRWDEDLVASKHRDVELFRESSRSNW